MLILFAIVAIAAPGPPSPPFAFFHSYGLCLGKQDAAWKAQHQILVQDAKRLMVEPLDKVWDGVEGTGRTPALGRGN